MSVNRFRRIVPVLDPTMYRFQERLQLPDLTGIGQVASALQTSYDTKIPRPQHIQKDAPLVDQYFVKPVEGLKSKAIDAFKSGDTSQGINYMKQMEQFIYNAKQPGGAYNAFEDTYKRAQDYIKSTTDNKDIAKDTKDFSINKSLSNFTTFDEQGQRNVFQGYTPAKDVDLNDYFTKLTKDWAETEWIKGYRPAMNGQYYDQRTGKKVSKEEIVGTLRDSWMNNPDIAPYVQQLTEMYGKDEALARVSSAINLAAEKEAFESETSKLVGNKEYDIQGRLRVAREKQKLKDDSDMRTQISAAFQYDPVGAQDLTLRDGRVIISTNTTPKGKIDAKGVVDMYSPYGVKHGSTQVIDKGLNELVSDPKMKTYFDERPGLKGVIASIPSAGKTPTQFNKEVEGIYKQLQNNRAKTMEFDFMKPKEMSEVENVLLNKRAIINNQVYALSNTGKPQYLDPKDLDLKKVTLYGKTKGGNGFYPGSYFGTVEKNGTVLQVVVEPVDYQTGVHYAPFKALMQPTYTYEPSPWVKINLPSGQKTIRSKSLIEYDDPKNPKTVRDINLQFEEQVDGKVVPLTGIDKNAITSYFEQNAPQ